MSIADVLKAHRELLWDHTKGNALCSGCAHVLCKMRLPMEYQHEHLRIHQEDMLAEAGYGDIREAKAQALEEAANNWQRHQAANMGNGKVRPVIVWLKDAAQRIREGNDS